MRISVLSTPHHLLHTKKESTHKNCRHTMQKNHDTSIEMLPCVHWANARPVSSPLPPPTGPNMAQRVGRCTLSLVAATAVDIHPEKMRTAQKKRPCIIGPINRHLVCVRTYKPTLNHLEPLARNHCVEVTMQAVLRGRVVGSHAETVVGVCSASGQASPIHVPVLDAQVGETFFKGILSVFSDVLSFEMSTFVSGMPTVLHQFAAS